MNIKNSRYENEVGDVALFEAKESAYRISYQSFLNMMLITLERSKDGRTSRVEVLLDLKINEMPGRFILDADDFINQLFVKFWTCFSLNCDYYSNGIRVSYDTEQLLKLLKRDTI